MRDRGARHDRAASSDRVKTDQRDAERLLRLLIDGLHAVRVPSTAEEALRDLVRTREDIRGDLVRARQRMSKLLLRHDVRFEGTAATWTTHHRRWLGAVDLGDPGAQVTLLDYLVRSPRCWCAAPRSRPRSTSSCPARQGEHDREERQRARPPALGRRLVALPPSNGQGPPAQASPSRPTRARHRDQLASAAAPASHLAAT